MIRTISDFPCSSCGQSVLFDEVLYGGRKTCPKCNATLQVPELPKPARLVPPSTPTIIRVEPSSARSRRKPTALPQPGPPSAGRDWLTTFLFAFFLGWLGVDRFYNRRTGLGLGKLLTGGGCGFWSLFDVILLLTKQYQDSQGHYLRPAKRNHMVIALSIGGAGILLNAVLIGFEAQNLGSELASLKAKISNPDIGFASPEAVFEAMKTDAHVLTLIVPEDRPLFASMHVHISRMLVAFQVEERKKKQAEQRLSALLEKHHLTGKLDLDASSTMEQDRAAAVKAFAGVDLVALMEDLDTFMNQYQTENFSISTDKDDAKPVSLKNLKIEGNEAKAIAVSSDGSEEPLKFIQSGGRWFLFWE